MPYKNKEDANANKRKYYAEHPERYKIQRSKINKVEKFLYDKKYRELNRENISARQKIYRQSFERRYMGWLNGAKTRGISFNLSIEYLKSLPLICYYTGKELSLETDKPNTISLERINPNDGYSEGNIVFCCSDINYMKNDLTKDEFINNCKEVYLHSLEVK